MRQLIINIRGMHGQSEHNTLVPISLVEAYGLMVFRYQSARDEGHSPTVRERSIVHVRALSNGRASAS